MADTKLSALTADTPTTDDLMYAVDDPGGSPTSKKVTVGNVLDIINGDVNVDSSGAATFNTGAIVNADINASAAIALSSRICGKN